MCHVFFFSNITEWDTKEDKRTDKKPTWGAQPVGSDSGGRENMMEWTEKAMVGEYEQSYVMTCI